MTFYKYASIKFIDVTLIIVSFLFIHRHSFTRVHNLQSAGGSPASLRPGRWLDLYSGTGSVGIEAMSRGCSEVVKNSC